MASTSRTPLVEDFERACAARASALRSSAARERAAGLAGARADLEQLAERDRHHRQREAQQAEAQLASALQDLEQQAEAQRRGCAAKLLEVAFADCDDSLQSLIKHWRVEPGRANTTAICTEWHRLDARCRVEVGAELGAHIILATFITAIDGETPGALTSLASVDCGWGVDTVVVEQLGRWQRAVEPVAAQHALEVLEQRLLEVARCSAGEPVSEYARELHAGRCTSATAADWSRAQAEVAAKQKDRAAAAFAHTYKAPPTLSEMVQSLISRGAPPPNVSSAE